jgi:hypothetical protein
MTSVVVPLQASHWTLGLSRNNRGAPLGNLRNVLFALRNAPEWQGVLAYDEFAARVITQKPLPWGIRGSRGGPTSTTRMHVNGCRSRGFRWRREWSGALFRP